MGASIARPSLAKLFKGHLQCTARTAWEAEGLPSVLVNSHEVLATLSAHILASESNFVDDKINELLSHSVLDNISSICHFTLQRHHYLKPIKQVPGRASTSPGSSVCLCTGYLIGLPNRNSKEYVPRPVTGSHPELAEKPFVLQPGLSPVVMSWRTLGLAYCSIMISQTSLTESGHAYQSRVHKSYS